MAEIISFKLKGTYEAALRDQDPLRRHSKGYPALRDPAAETPVGMLFHASKADEHKLRQHYGPSIQRVIE